MTPNAKTAHSQLAQDNSWARCFVDASVDAIIVICEGGSIQYFNPAAQRLFGVDASEMLGENVSTLMPEPYSSQHDAYIARYLREGGPRIIGIGREVVARRRDGSEFPAYLSVCETRFDGRRMFVGNVHDVSDLHAEMAEKDAALSALNKRNIELACIYRVGQAVRSQESLADIFEDLLPMLASAFEHQDITVIRACLDDATLQSDNFVETDWRIEAPIIVAGRRRGSIQVFYLEERPHKGDGPFHREERTLVEGVASALGETIERREAEAQVYNASKLASVGELAAGVSHEINNPVNGILNCADILLSSIDEGTPEHEYAVFIRSEAERIAKIVRSLLTFSGHNRETAQPAHISEIVDSVLNLCRKRIAHSQVLFSVDVPPNLPQIRCRAHEVQQVLMNLIINGLHALDARYPDADPDKIMRLSVAETALDGRPAICISVEDHGTGIANVHRERIFDPFFTTKGRDKGTGLGLSVSNGIVKNHGGKIDVETEPGKGSTFHVVLPLSPLARSDAGENA